MIKLTQMQGADLLPKKKECPRQGKQWDAWLGNYVPCECDICLEEYERMLNEK